METKQLLEQCRSRFTTGETRTYRWRMQQLSQLRTALLHHETALYEALWSDLHKSREETWVTETGFVLTGINMAMRNLKKWMRREKKSTNLLNLPSTSYVCREPLGVVLVIAPWNYPLQLLLAPLTGALAAGNTVVLKPSEFAPATNAVVRQIVNDAFDPADVLMVEGEGQVIIPAMMNAFRFDHVFYTGSIATGRKIYQLAADKLVPVTLELGGKSPCIIEADANIEVAARRIMMTKFSNAGQMCVAPDYVLVHESRKQVFVDACRKALLHYFGADASTSYEYGRIVNTAQFDRLAAFLPGTNLLHGGKTDRNTLYIEPTLVNECSPGSALMQEEIFGPILPVISFAEKQEAMEWIGRHPDPLALYVFTSSKENERHWVKNVSFGGGCINNAALHVTNHQLPFGGKGSSGMGRYHGRYSFDTFSHEKAVMRTPTWFDPDIRYPPFKGRLGLFRRLIR